MTPQLEWLVRLTLFLLAALLAIFGYLVVRKLWENAKRARIDGMKETYRQAVYGYLLSGSETRLIQPGRGSWKEEALEELLLQCATLFSGDDTTDRIRAFAEKYLSGRYRKLLKGRRWSLRVNSLYRVERFDLRMMAPELRAMAEVSRTTPEEFTLIYKLLAWWGEPDVIGRIAGHRQIFPDFQRRLILSQMPPPLFLEAIRRLDELPEAWRYTAVDVIGIRRHAEYRAELDRLAESADVEMRIRALKALSQFDLVPPKEKYLTHALSDSWQERMMAAKLYGTIRDGMYAESLRTLLADAVWFVRSQAAQSLLSYANGSEELREIAATSEDKYAREMAAEWLERGGAGRHVG